MKRLPRHLPEFMPALVCSLAGFVVFNFFGNATRGYIKTASLFWWWGRQWFDPASESEHGPLILIVAVVLFVRNLRASLQPSGWAPLTGGVLLVAGIALHVLGYAAQQTRLSIVALLVYAAGVLTLAGGTRWMRAALFPLGFLLLAVPINFLDTLGYYLRLGVVEVVAPIARALGIEVVRSGTQLFAPDGHYQYDVAAACSGVRSLVALLALGLLVGYLELRHFAARVLIVLLSLPIIFAGNVVRITAIVLTGEWGGRASGEQLHAWSGYLVFIVVLCALVFTVRRMKRTSAEAAPSTPTEVEQREGPSSAPTMAASNSRDWRRSGVVVTLFVIFTTGAAIWATRKLDALPMRSSTGVRLAEGGVDPVNLPAFLGTEWIGQRAEVTAPEREILPADTGYSRRNYVSLADRERQVFFSIVLSGRDRSSIHRPELCLGGQGWTIQNRFTHVFPGERESPLVATVLRIEREVLEGPERRRRIVPSLLAYWFVSGDTSVSTHSEMLWRSAADRLVRFRADRWAYVVLQTPLVNGDEAASLARMQEVLIAVWPTVRANPTH